MARMKVVVIGNGIGGFSATSAIRRLNSQCEITMISVEETPLYSACVLPDYIAGRISRERTFVKTDRDYKELDIQTLFGYEVKEINPDTKKVSISTGDALSFDRLVLATGSEAIDLGGRKKGAFKLKTLDDADAIVKHGGRKAVVVGSGAIGIEMAIALHARGYEVSIVEMLDQILPFALDQTAANKAKELLEEHGIEVFTGESAKTTLGNDCIEGLKTDRRELECDTLICALGMHPRVKLAQEAGIKIGDRGGIKVDSHMETDVSGIYACGDCVEFNDVITGQAALNLFWHNANRQGQVVGRNCAGFATGYPGSQNILNVDIFGNHVVAFGYTESTLSRFKETASNQHQSAGLSIIEKRENGTYFRLVISEDRCMGGQFINAAKDLGLIWSVMHQRKSIQELLKSLENEEVMRHRPWLYRLKPFFV